MFQNIREFLTIQTRHEYKLQKYTMFCKQDYSSKIKFKKKKNLK